MNILGHIISVVIISHLPPSGEEMLQKTFGWIMFPTTLFYCRCCCCRWRHLLLDLLVLRPSISSLLQSTKSVITKCDSFLLQSATSVISKCDRYYKVWQFYHKVREVLQSAKVQTIGRTIYDRHSTAAVYRPIVDRCLVVTSPTYHRRSTDTPPTDHRLLSCTY